MKRIMIAITILCSMMLSGCGIIEELRSGSDASVVLCEDFCTAISSDDFNTARKYLHPDSTPSAADLKEFLSNLEADFEIDFSDGLVLKRRKGSGMTYYDSIYDGSVYELTYEIVLGGSEIDMFFTVVKNDIGFGIYAFGVIY